VVVPADWKEVRLGDLGSTFGGLTGKTSRDFGEGNSRYITFMNVMSNVVLSPRGTERVRISSGERQTQVIEGDVIFNGSSETPEEVGFGSAVPATLNGLYLNSFCFGFRAKDLTTLNPIFFSFLTRSPLGRDIIRPMAQGSTRYNIAKTNLLNGRFPMPPFKEQEAIAEALSDADTAIESLVALIAKKRDVKQATMQQLLTGRTRLPGFTADWKGVRLGSFLSYEQPTEFLVSNSNYVEGGQVPVLTAGKSFLLGYTEDTNGIYKDLPTILFDDFTTATQWVDFEFKVKSSACKMLKPKSGACDLRYVYQRLRALDYRTSDHKRHWISVFHSMEMLMPPLKEQEAIADALSVIDDELEVLTKQATKLRMVKEGMMQDLLTGKVRLV
jgi:type I restriction enzyme S subunit